MVNKQLHETSVVLNQSSSRIETQISSLTTALSEASTELRIAGTQSGTLGRRLNWLTGVVAFAALISAAATAFYAWETKRQVQQSAADRTLTALESLALLDLSSATAACSYGNKRASGKKR